MKKDLNKFNRHVVFVTPSMFFGGAERVMSILMNELVERKYNVSLIYLNDSHTISYSLSEKVNCYFVKGVRFNTITNFASPIKILRKILNFS